MQRERSQTISVFPVTASHPAHSLSLQHSHNNPSTFDYNGSSVASTSTRSPLPPSSHLIHLAPAGSDSFRFLADLAEDPSHSILFPLHQASHAAPLAPLSLFDDHTGGHHREDSLSSQFEYVFGGPLNSLHSQRKSRTGAQPNPLYCDENDPLAQNTRPSSSLLITAPAALDACSFAASTAPPPASTSPAYPRYRGGPAKKKKKPLRQRIFSRRNKFVLLSSLVPLFSLVLVLIAAYTSRVRYPKFQKMATQYVPVKDSFPWYQVGDTPLYDADQHAYEIEYPVFPPEKFFNLYNPIIRMDGALLKPRNPAAPSHQRNRFSDNRYTRRVPFRKNGEIGPPELITLTVHSFAKETPFFYYEHSLVNVGYLLEAVTIEDPYFVYDEGYYRSKEPVE